ncbi:MAG: ribbon-helix-helix protein, CopG family [Cyanobacteria bacterium]|nr:ribbon-helix-helix protein, CopG family [Cyanobacteriota bacterium]
MNITLSIDDAVIEKARKLAHARGTSVNQMVRDYLESLVRPAERGRFGTELRTLTAAGKGRSKGWRFSRESLHERR